MSSLGTDELEAARTGIETADARTPRVSIVVPVYNGERYVRESLDSILGQTYPDTEVIVVDDASTDAAPEIVCSYRDPRMRYVRQPVNLGIFGNLNTGLGLARGELVALHHADDVYDTRILEREIAFLDCRPEVGAVFAIDTFIDGEGREFGRLELPPEFRGERVLSYADVLNGFLRYGNTFIRGGTSLVRRQIYEGVGFFDSSYDLRADLDMWLRIARQTEIVILDEHLVAYRWGHDNTSARYEHLRTEPEISFAIMDRKLAEGDFALAAPDALAAYEGRRAVDLLRVAVNQYIRDDLAGMRDTMLCVSLRRILDRSSGLSVRLLVVWLGLHALGRVPRIAAVAAIFCRRQQNGRR